VEVAPHLAVFVFEPAASLVEIVGHGADRR
jgi:hypothetical protein